MTRLFTIHKFNEETPVQYVGVYVLAWRGEWGEPTALFAEVDDPVYDAAKELLEACKCGHGASEGWLWDILTILQNNDRGLAELFRSKMKIEHNAIASAEGEQ